jgi:hypothetical protein
VAGKAEDGNPRIWTESSAASDATVATYATETQRRLTLDVPLLRESEGRTEINNWLQEYSDFNKTN